jgi:hypothetical protein
MTGTRRARSAKAKSFPAGIVEEGAERYIWVFPEGEQVVLAIPGLRGLQFSVEEARAVAEMLTQAADEITTHQKNPSESGGGYGSAEERPVEGGV